MDSRLKPVSPHIPQSHKDIMRRVRMVAFMLTLVSSPLAGVVVVLSLVFVSGMIVSLDHILVNTLAYTDWGARLTYDFYSFEHTQIIVQVLVVCIALVVLYSFVNSVRTIRRSGFFSLFLLKRAG